MPVYNLRNLINAKYGHRSFMTGCGIVAQWVNHNCKKHYTAQQINGFCALENEVNICFNEQEREALRQLFGLYSADQLYTKFKP